MIVGPNGPQLRNRAKNEKKPEMADNLESV